MAAVDMDLPALRAYTGRGPRPEDFERFWDTAREELEAVDAEAALEKSDFQVPGVACCDLWFTGVRGARIHAKYLRPAEPEAPCPLVLLFHGYGDGSGPWYDKLAFVSSGFCVAALDCRGQGGLPADRGGTFTSTFSGQLLRGVDAETPHELLFRHIFLDAVQLARIAMGFPEVDVNRVAAYGGAQGGGLSLACAALEPRIRRAVAIQPFLCDYRRVWELDFADSAYAEIQQYFRKYDPFHEREAAFFERLAYIDVQHLAPWVRADTLMITGLLDTTCPPSSQFAVFNKLGGSKQMLVCPDHEHFAYRYIPEFLPGIYDKAYQFILELGR